MKGINVGDIVYRWGHKRLVPFKVVDIKDDEVQHPFGGWFPRRNVYTKDEALVEIKEVEVYHKKLLSE